MTATKHLTIQTYDNRHFVLSNGIIIGDFRNLSDAESIVSANTEKKTPKRKPNAKKTAEDFEAFGYPVSKMQQA